MAMKNKDRVTPNPTSRGKQCFDSVGRSPYRKIKVVACDLEIMAGSPLFIEVI